MCKSSLVAYYMAVQNYVCIEDFYRVEDELS